MKQSDNHQAQSPPAPPTQSSTRLTAALLTWLRLIGPLIGLLLIYALFAVIAPPSFRTVANLKTLARQTAIVGTAALGMTMIMISGGIDLSVGSVVALSTVVIASLLQNAQFGPIPAVLAGILAGAACGLLNGLVITRLRVVPFIVTLGMMLIARGAAKAIGHEQKVNAPMTWVQDMLTALPGKLSVLIVPPGVWLLIVLALLVAGLLRYTKLGRHLFAIGSNEETARLCGIPVPRIKVINYVVGGAFFGLAGAMLFSRLTVGDPTAAVGLELDVIAAVVIGGGSLAGGEGSVFGSMVGALIMTVIRSGCAQMGLPNWVQEVVTGIVIVIAVALDRLRHRRVSE